MIAGFANTFPASWGYDSAGSPGRGKAIDRIFMQEFYAGRHPEQEPGREIRFSAHIVPPKASQFLKPDAERGEVSPELARRFLGEKSGMGLDNGADVVYTVGS